MKKLFSIAIALLLLSYASIAQDPTAIKYGKTITADDLRKHLTIVASDEFEGRETGTKGIALAEEYIMNHFKNIGLKGPVNGSYFQNVELFNVSVGNKSIKSGKNVLKFIDDFYFLNDVNTANFKKSEVVFVGFGLELEDFNELKGLDLTGKIVVMLAGDPSFEAGVANAEKMNSAIGEYALTRKKMENIRAKNPAAVFISDENAENNIRRFRAFLEGSRIGFKPENTATAIPTFYLTPAALSKLLGGTINHADVKAGINKTGKTASKALKMDITVDVSRKYDPIIARNVLGFLEGTDLKEEVLVITAHHDHIGISADGQINNGADDDGSGTVAVMELAEAFAKAKAEGNGPRRSILFMTVTAEEKGLLGSQYYSNNPIFPIENTVTNLNIDMIGRIDKDHVNDSNYVYIIGSDKLSTELHAIGLEANEKYTKLNLDFRYNDPKDPNRFYYRSDHYNFARLGIPIIFYFTGVHEDYHRPGDEAHKIAYNIVEKRARLVFYTAWMIANRDKRPVVDVENDFPSNR